MSENDSTFARRGNQFKNIAGQVFARLTVIEFAGISENGDHAEWRCRCECGAVTVVAGSRLRSGGTKSCGCLAREATTTHGLSGKPIYHIWESMLARCTNHKHWYYRHYGGRGISVCERWQSFENFLADMGPPPSAKHQIDRYPNQNGNYEVGNCRWATSTENNRNRRNNHLVTHDGLTLCVAEWAEKIGVARRTLDRRLKRGWSIEDALGIPTLHAAPNEKRRYLSRKGDQQ